jgi:integrase
MPRNPTRKAHRNYPGVYLNPERARWEQRVVIEGRSVFVSAKTPAEVAAKVADARNRAATGMVPSDQRTTVQTFLDWWLSEVVDRSLKPSTAVTYRHIVSGYIVPHIGKVTLLKLSPADVTKMLDALARQGLSTNTQRAARSVLRRALRRAQVEGLVQRNVAQLADGVRVVTKPGRTMTPDEARKFLDHVADDRLGAAFVVMLALGLRRGELLGLAWGDIDLDAERPSLRVSRTLQRLPVEGLVVDTPKTKTSGRQITLPTFTAEALSRHRELQKADALAAGKEWVALPLGLDLVFRTQFGTAIDPANFKTRTARLTAEAGLGRWTPHELRHSAASIMLAAGVPLKELSESLGHSSIRITADVYAHLLEPARHGVADAVQKILG